MKDYEIVHVVTVFGVAQTPCASRLSCRGLSSPQLRRLVWWLKLRFPGNSVRATFALSIEANAGLVRDLSPQIVSLEPGAFADAVCRLDIPDGSEGDVIDLLIKAADTTDDARNNGISTQLWVSYRDDVDRDSVRDVEDDCPTLPNGDQIDAGRDGIGDACQNPQLVPPIFSAATDVVGSATGGTGL